MKQRSAVTPLSLGTDRLATLLVRYAIPSIIAMTSTSLYNIIDSIFIGHGVGAMAISGLALTMPLMNISSAFGAMVGIGAAAIISIRLGEGNRAAAEKTLGNVVLLNSIIGVMLMTLSILFLDPILYFFGASEQTLPYARDFMQIILAGSIITHMFLGLNEVLRASGYPQKAMMLMLTSVGVNCALNPLFIFVFGWGIRGSALATVIAQTVALSISLKHFSNPTSFLHFKRGVFRFRKKIVAGILSIGTAPFLLHLCASVVVIFVNKALQNNGGDLYIGAYGVINRVVMLFIMVVSGLNQGMQPIVGYNYGAKQYLRVMKTLFMTIFCATCVTTTGFLIGQLFPRQVALLFVGSGDADSARLIEAVCEGLRIVVMCFPIVGFQIVTSNFFQYIGKPKRAILLSMTRQMLFLVPMLILLPPHYGTLGVWWSMPIADCVATLLAAGLLLHQIRWFRRAIADNQP
ncbi:MAG: MATE family efflux transporter [Rikenellaceae bacterium]|nr:MATE family efflux transporter [Rikenellaceae bacterium]